MQYSLWIGVRRIRIILPDPKGSGSRSDPSSLPSNFPSSLLIHTSSLSRPPSPHLLQNSSLAPPLSPSSYVPYASPCQKVISVFLVYVLVNCYWECYSWQVLKDFFNVFSTKKNSDPEPNPHKKYRIQIHVKSFRNSPRSILARVQETVIPLRHMSTVGWTRRCQEMLWLPYLNKHLLYLFTPPVHLVPCKHGVTLTAHTSSQLIWYKKRTQTELQAKQEIICQC